MNESTLLELPALGRGRPSAVMLEERARLSRVIEGNRKRLASSQSSSNDHDLLESIRYRFGMLNRFAVAAAAGEVRCLMASGSPGIGKSYDLMQTLDDIIPGDYEVIEGGDITPVQLFMAGWRNRDAGKVLVFDDSDGLFMKDECCNILKKLTDTTKNRRLTYMKTSPVLEAEGIPQEYEFEGSVIFLSNIDLEKMAAGTDKRAMHIQAFLSRSLVLDLKIHSMRSKYVWVRQRAQEAILPALKATAEESAKVLEFVDAHFQEFKSLSLRSVQYIVTMIRGNPLEWEKDARIMLLRHQ
jgi:hypothetical protein